MSRTRRGAYRPRRALPARRQPGFRGWASLVTACAVILALLPIGRLTGAAFTGKTGTAVQAQASLFPTVMSQSVWWLDASRPTTLFADPSCTTPAGTAIGSPVACWVDRRQPTHKVVTGAGQGTAQVGSNQNGMRTVNFVSADRLVGPDYLGGSVSALTIFLVSRENVASNNMLINLNGQSSPQRLSMHVPWGSNRNFYFDAGNATSDRVQTTSNLVPLGSVALLVGTKDPATTRDYLRVNGHPFQSTGHNAAITTGGLSIGDNLALANHDILELIVFATALNNADRASVETYLAQKWAATLS